MRNSSLLSICLFLAMPAFAAGPAAKPPKPPESSHAEHAHHDHSMMAPMVDAAWTTQPLLLPMAAQRGDRSGAPFALVNAQAAAISAISGDPSAPVGSFAIANGKTTVRTAPGVGNYYWLQAQEEAPNLVRVASTVRYFTNPGPSPRALLRKPKSDLEIVPQPLPREHGQYREGDRWAFLVRFRNQPLAGKKVAFETENGTHATYTTDNDGLIAVDFPRDMKPDDADNAGGHGAPKAQFALSVAHADRGKSYATAFNYQYEPRASAGKSTTAGIGFIVLGAIFATPLLRRRQEQKKGKTS